MVRVEARVRGGRRLSTGHWGCRDAAGCRAAGGRSRTARRGCRAAVDPVGRNLRAVRRGRSRPSPGIAETLAVPEEEPAADAAGDRPTSPRRMRADRATSVPRTRGRGVILTFASLYNDPTQWAWSLRGGLRRAPGGARPAPTGPPAPRWACAVPPAGRALAEARRRTGRLRAPGSGGRPSRHRDRLRPVRMGATGEVPDPSSRSARRRGRWDRRRMGPASRSYPQTPVRRAWTVPRTRLRSGEGPTAVIGSEDVDFDVAAAVALVPRCRSAAEQARTLHSSRTGRASSIPGGRCR